MSTKDQTSITLNKALSYARGKSINPIVVASVSGKTAEMLLPYCNKFSVICVSHGMGYSCPAHPGYANS